jgi:8-hydroxy-5-deazaflavin:NADPH oxidoreductase
LTAAHIRLIKKVSHELEIGIIGGTGDLGRALALHLARQHKILIGSREKSKAESAILQIFMQKGERDYLRNNLEATENREAVSRCDLLILAVPHSTALELIAQLTPYFREDQILISAVSVVNKSEGEFVAESGTLSIAQQIQDMLKKGTNVAIAFQTVPAHILYKEKSISSDVLVACDDKKIYPIIADVVSSIPGLRPLYAGSLKISKSIEALTAILLDLAINNRLKSPTLKLISF